MGVSDRKNMEDVVVEDGSEFVSKTIVGGRPRRRKTYRMNVPANIEKLLYRAAVDETFRAALIADRKGTIAAHRMALTASENAILESVPDGTLLTMIGQIRPKMHGKRRFMRAVAVAAVTLATGTAGVACEEAEPTGISPDVPEEVGDVPEEVDGDVPHEFVDMPADLGETADVPDSDSPDDPADQIDEQEAD
jgi:hypothetical protein